MAVREDSLTTTHSESVTLEGPEPGLVAVMERALGKFPPSRIMGSIIKFAVPWCVISVEPRRQRNAT